jgi:hypothetical protein
VVCDVVASVRLHLNPGRRLDKAEPEIKVKSAEEAVGFHVPTKS